MDQSMQARSTNPRFRLIMMFLHMTVMMVIMMMMGHARINVEFANQKVFGHLTAILFDERVNNALS